MRCVPGVVLALLVALPALAQPNRGEVVVRGCVVDNRFGERPELRHRGLVLHALGPGQQTFDAPTWIEEGTLFSLIGDRGLLDDLAVHTGESVEVTARLNPENPIYDVRDPALIETPRFPGIGQQAPPTRQRALGRQPSANDELEVIAYRRRSFDCPR